MPHNVDGMRGRKGPFELTFHALADASDTLLGSTVRACRHLGLVPTEAPAWVVTLVRQSNDIPRLNNIVRVLIDMPQPHRDLLVAAAWDVSLMTSEPYPEVLADLLGL